ncbi:zinc ribbon domain-containing protein [Micromonospora arida]
MPPGVCTVNASTVRITRRPCPASPCWSPTGTSTHGRRLSWANKRRLVGFDRHVQVPAGSSDSPGAGDLRMQRVRDDHHPRRATQPGRDLLQQRRAATSPVEPATWHLTASTPGLIYCAACDRRMQGQYSHGDAYYRCRFPQEYALANQVQHPSNVYLCEDTLTDPARHLASLRLRSRPHRTDDHHDDRCPASGPTITTRHSSPNDHQRVRRRASTAATVSRYLYSPQVGRERRGRVRLTRGPVCGQRFGGRVTCSVRVGRRHDRCGGSPVVARRAGVYGLRQE